MAKLPLLALLCLPVACVLADPEQGNSSSEMPATQALRRSLRFRPDDASLIQSFMPVKKEEPEKKPERPPKKPPRASGKEQCDPLEDGDFDAKRWKKIVKEVNWPSFAPVDRASDKTCIDKSSRLLKVWNSLGTRTPLAPHLDIPPHKTLGDLFGRLNSSAYMRRGYRPMQLWIGTSQQDSCKFADSEQVRAQLSRPQAGGRAVLKETANPAINSSLAVIVTFSTQMMRPYCGDTDVFTIPNIKAVHMQPKVVKDVSEFQVSNRNYGIVWPRRKCTRARKCGVVLHFQGGGANTENLAKWYENLPSGPPHYLDEWAFYPGCYRELDNIIIQHRQVLSEGWVPEKALKHFVLPHFRSFLRKHRLVIDKDRVYCGGLSNGGWSAYTAAVVYGQDLFTQVFLSAPMGMWAAEKKPPPGFTFTANRKLRRVVIGVGLLDTLFHNDRDHHQFAMSRPGTGSYQPNDILTMLHNNQYLEGVATELWLYPGAGHPVWTGVNNQIKDWMWKGGKAPRESRYRPYRPCPGPEASSASSASTASTASRPGASNATKARAPAIAGCEADGRAVATVFALLLLGSLWHGRSAVFRRCRRRRTAKKAPGGLGDLRPEVSADPRKYHGEVAQRNLHWWNSTLEAWVTRETPEADWSGYRWHGGVVAQLPQADCRRWSPWAEVLDDSEPPFYRWFVGGLTNAAFNEVDRHVLAGHGAEKAYISVSEDGQTSGVSREALFLDSCAAAMALQETADVACHDRVLLSLPADVLQIPWIEACKRSGLVYCCCAPGLKAGVLASRLADLGARVAVTLDADPWRGEMQEALRGYAPLSAALQVFTPLLGSGSAGQLAKLSSDGLVVEIAALRGCAAVVELPSGERDEALRSLESRSLGASVQPLFLDLGGAAAAGSLGAAYAEARERLGKETSGVADAAELVSRVWGTAGAPIPIEANAPMFVIYTSGSTGRPKGIVHCHGGYASNVTETMWAVFGAKRGSDVMLTVANPGWITGQSYQITGPLCSRVTAVLMAGPPISAAHPLRFAKVIRSCKVTIFKAGSTFLRAVMMDPDAGKGLEAKLAGSALRVATFCAEPVSPAVQAFAMAHICPRYVNSYWATEHGSIVWTHVSGLLRADAGTQPLPWVQADVAESLSEPERAAAAAEGVRGDVVILTPYPSLFRLVWGDPGGYGSPGWRGDPDRLLATYWKKLPLGLGGSPVWAFCQGDYAQKVLGGGGADGVYTFHGRSDEVINVNGVRIGTEQVEGAVLRDKASCPRLGGCVVIGVPHDLHGEVPLACVLRSDPAVAVLPEDVDRWLRLVQNEVGTFPLAIIEVEAIPETFSGKFMRRFIKDIATLGRPKGDTSGLRNPESLLKLQASLADWKGALRYPGKGPAPAAAPASSGASDKAGSAPALDSLGFARSAASRQADAWWGAVHSVYGMAVCMVALRHWLPHGSRVVFTEPARSGLYALRTTKFQMNAFFALGGMITRLEDPPAAWRKEVVMLLLFVGMAWPTASEHTLQFGTYHRWTLLWLCLARLNLAFLEKLRLHPVFQVLFAYSAAWFFRGNAGIIRAQTEADPELLWQNGLLLVVDSVFWSLGHKLYWVAMFCTGYHVGLPSLIRLSSAEDALKCRCAVVFLRAIAWAVFLGSLLAFVQIEKPFDGGGHLADAFKDYPHFFEPLWALPIKATAEWLQLASALLAARHGVPGFEQVGAHVLGIYVVHPYWNMGIVCFARGGLNSWLSQLGFKGGCLQLLLLITFPLAFGLTIGTLAWYLILKAPQAALRAALRCPQAACVRRKSSQSYATLHEEIPLTTLASSQAEP